MIIKQFHCNFNILMFAWTHYIIDIMLLKEIPMCTYSRARKFTKCFTILDIRGYIW